MKTFSPRISLIIIAVVTLAGCAIGPNFRSPNMATPNHYTVAPLPTQTASAPSESTAAQRFAFAKDLPGEWWTLFRSPELDKMIKQGLADSPTLAAAQAALRKSEEDLRAVSGSILYPAVNANLQASRQRISGNADAGPSDTFNLITLLSAFPIHLIFLAADADRSKRIRRRSIIKTTFMRRLI